MSQRAVYFHILDGMRAENTHIYYHDETWCNVGEEKRSIWLSDRGEGRLRKSDGKGKRLAISAMINEHGFDKETTDIFTCDEEHSMNSTHFVHWIRHAASLLRRRHPEPRRICIVIDNATWHNELCDNVKPPKRSWRKIQVQEWLDQHEINYDSSMTKAQLLELAFANVPPKKFKTNEAAAEHNVQIVRLPIKHCTLNPIELAWAALKKHVRKYNTSFVSNLYLRSRSSCAKT